MLISADNASPFHISGFAHENGMCSGNAYGRRRWLGKFVQLIRSGRKVLHHRCEFDSKVFNPILARNPLPCTAFQETLGAMRRM